MGAPSGCTTAKHTVFLPSHQVCSGPSLVIIPGQRNNVNSKTLKKIRNKHNSITRVMPLRRNAAHVVTQHSTVWSAVYKVFYRHNSRLLWELTQFYGRAMAGNHEFNGPWEMGFNQHPRALLCRALFWYICAVRHRNRDRHSSRYYGNRISNEYLNVCARYYAEPESCRSYVDIVKWMSFRQYNAYDYYTSELRELLH
jgi:hypothetical protein